MYQFIEPEVPGGLGNNSIIDTSVHPPIVEKLELEFDGWLGDDIIEVFPCYAITEVLKIKIENEKLSGIDFKSVTIIKSEEFLELFPKIDLPTFYWAKIIGTYEKDDFFIGKDFRLILSEKAFSLLKQCNVENATFEEIKDVG